MEQRPGDAIPQEVNQGQRLADLPFGEPDYEFATPLSTADQRIIQLLEQIEKNTRR